MLEVTFDSSVKSILPGGGWVPVILTLLELDWPLVSVATTCTLF